MKLPVIILALVLMATPALAVNTFVFTPPGQNLGSSNTPGLTDPTPENDNLYTIDLRGVKAFSIHLQHAASYESICCAPGPYPQPPIKIPFPVPNAFTLQISLDDGETWDCLGETCAIALAPAVIEGEDSVSTIIQIPIYQRKSNALLRYAYIERNNPPKGSPRAPQNYIQFFQ